MNFPMKIDEIEKLIPHKRPFLLVDTIDSYVPFGSIQGRFKIQRDDRWFQGHFPGEPIYPGFLLLEGMAQTSTVLACLSSPEKIQKVRLAQVEKARFREAAFPGDELRYHIVMKKKKENFFWFFGKASRDNAELASADFVAFLL